jgi:hypothetical protein
MRDAKISPCFAPAARQSNVLGASCSNQVNILKVLLLQKRMHQQNKAAARKFEFYKEFLDNESILDLYLHYYLIEAY